MSTKLPPEILGVLPGAADQVEVEVDPGHEKTGPLIERDRSCFSAPVHHAGLPMDRVTHPKALTAAL